MAKKAKKVDLLESDVVVPAEAEEAVVVVSSLGFMEKDSRFEDIGGGLFKVLPSALKPNEALVEKNGRKFVEFMSADQATYLL